MRVAVSRVELPKVRAWPDMARQMGALTDDHLGGKWVAPGGHVARCGLPVWRLDDDTVAPPNCLSA